jgi:hypothetical protein
MLLEKIRAFPLGNISARAGVKNTSRLTKEGCLNF